VTNGIVDLPQYTWRPLPGTRPQIIPTQLIAHTAVSNASSLYGWFNSPTAKGTDAHTYIRADGTAEQYRAANTQANANGTANRWWDRDNGVFRGAFSVETWDGRDPEHTPWTPQQITTLRDTALWLNRVYRIPLEICPGPYDPGIAWHSLYPGWSPGRHTCPGALRITQFHDELLPAITTAATTQIGDITVPTNPTFGDIANFVETCFTRAANPDPKGRTYWTVVIAEAVNPLVPMRTMANQLGLI